VGRYAEIIAEFLGMNKEFRERIRHAAPLHDIGKVGIPDSILLKPGKLEDLEFKQMMRHAEFGEAICTHGLCPPGDAVQSHAVVGYAITRISGSPILKMAGKIAYTHHERWDGKGYPRGLRGDAIPIEGRITAVADVFDALTSRRPYKKAFPLDKSLEIIGQQRGTQFDPGCVDAFFAGIERIVAVYHEFAEVAGDQAQPDVVVPGCMFPDPLGVGSDALPPLVCALPDTAATYTYSEQSA
jgi:putative two-component system response regulator